MPNLQDYLDHIKADYARWLRLDTKHPEIVEEMIAEFAVTVEKGSSYIKVVKGRTDGTGRSVHSFIVLKDNDKFKRGDILKAASWAAPARNFARGNLLNKDFNNVIWTGA